MEYSAEDLLLLDGSQWLEVDLDGFFIEHSGRVISELLGYIGGGVLEGGVLERDDLTSSLYIEAMPRLQRALAANPLREGGERFKLLYGVLRSASRTALLSHLPSITPFVGYSLDVLMEQLESVHDDCSVLTRNQPSPSSSQFFASSVLEQFSTECSTSINDTDSVLARMLHDEKLLGERLELKRGDLTTTQYKALYGLFFSPRPSDIAHDKPATPATLENIRCKLYRMVPDKLKGRYELLSVLPRRERATYLERVLLSEHSASFTSEELQLIKRVLIKIENPRNFAPNKNDIHEVWFLIQRLRNKVLPLLDVPSSAKDSFIPACFNYYLERHFESVNVVINELLSVQGPIPRTDLLDVFAPLVRGGIDLSTLKVKQRNAAQRAINEYCRLLKCMPSRQYWRRTEALSFFDSYMRMQGVND
jgi:hypothetical protein